MIIEEITVDQYRAMKQKAVAKFRNVRETYDGYTFDSKAEAARYRHLKLLEAAGEIADLVVHPTYELQPGFSLGGRRKIRAIKYEGDFAYTRDGQQIVEDVKGVETKEFQIKYKLFLFRYPAIDLRIIPAWERSRRPGRPQKRAA